MAIIQSNPYLSAAQPEGRAAEEVSRQPALQRGQFQGERVVLVPASQSLADAAEELTFAFSERAELSLSKRKLSDSHARISEIEALVGEYLDKVPELERQQKIKEMVSHLGSGRLANLSQLLAYLESYSGEVSEQFEALCQARTTLAGRPEMQGTLNLIEQALAKLADEQGTAIVLGARITGPATEAARQGVGSEQALRDLYRDAVQDYRALSSAWRDIHHRFGNGSLEKVTGFMMKALGADLDSQQRWLDPVKLERVMSDMHKLRLLNTLSAQVDELWLRVKEGAAHGIRAF
ncbi:type III secretion system gatekeeper subunit SctW [Aeromonas hydrophila]|uniref:type III secretion system gatekeeper subunit SctW n=1 Tax=Aeromonas hydrophila TaxID=644 RepID=UPI00111818DB|nr:type III secretion system gatekeeper subunit SctW [Aeromonas hydrophila]EIS3740633.1 type III secretion system gatekeeper subunit SctW [Aeromonas hydrophila]